MPFWKSIVCCQVGLVEQEWLDTLSTINPDEVTFLDYVEAGKKLGAQLKQEVILYNFTFVLYLWN